MPRVPKKCEHCNEIYWCELSLISEAVHGCRGENKLHLIETIIHEARSYKIEKIYVSKPKTLETYICNNCDRKIQSKSKRVYCCRSCYHHHHTKLANERWIKRNNVKRKPASWVNNALNMRATKSEGSWLKKYKSVRG
jgi:hypothetical protein